MRRTRLPPWLAVVPLLALIACGGRRAPGTTERVPIDPSTIGPRDLETGHWNTAEEIVRALRPHWLVDRGPDSIRSGLAGVQVRMDDMWLGGLTALRDVSALDVVAMEFIDPVAAAGRWGGNFRDGVIVITGRPRRPPEPPLSS